MRRPAPVFSVSLLLTLPSPAGICALGLVFEKFYRIDYEMYFLSMYSSYKIIYLNCLNVFQFLILFISLSSHPQELWPAELRPKPKKRKRPATVASQEKIAARRAQDDMLQEWLKVLEHKPETVELDIKPCIKGESWRDRLADIESSLRKIQPGETEEAWTKRLAKFEVERNSELKALNEDAWLQLEKKELCGLEEEEDAVGDEDRIKKVKTEDDEDEVNEEGEDEEEYDDEGDYNVDYYDSGDNDDAGDDNDGCDGSWY